jgi:Rrf2 family protein
MIINKKFLHAIEAVLDISIHSSHTPASAKEITKRQGIPSRYLEKILQELVRKKILKGTRGPSGGYVLGREKRNIFLIDIYNAVLTIEKNKKEEVDTQIRSKIINPFIKNITNEIINSFKLTSIHDLYKKIDETKININKKKIDFTI